MQLIYTLIYEQTAKCQTKFELWKKNIVSTSFFKTIFVILVY